MAKTVRLLAPAAHLARAPHENHLPDRSKGSLPGDVIDHAAESAHHLVANNGWLRICMSGGTADRPAAGHTASAGMDWSVAGFVAAPGFLFWDLDLAEMLAWDGGAWRRVSDGSAA